MKPSIRLTGLLFFALMLASCVPVGPRAPEIKLPPERILQKGYSIMPLNEEGWHILGRDQYRVALAKSGTGADETFAIQATVLDLPSFTSPDDLVRVVKEGQMKDTDLKRFNVMKHEVVSHRQKEADCAKSHFVIEDTGAVKRTPRTGSMILEAMSINCAYPKNKNMGISVNYSHRYYPENKDANFVDRATAVLDSLEFENL